MRTNSPVANYKGELFSLPFNMYTFNKMWGVVTPEEAAAKIEEQRKEARRIAKEVAKAQGLDPLRPEGEEEVLSDEELEKAAMGELDIEDIDEVMAEKDEEENE